MSQNNITVRIRQLGQPVGAFRGCRFVSAGRFTGTIAGVACFDSVSIGEPNDRRRGRTVSPSNLYGPFTVELFDTADSKVGTIGVGSVADVAAHPNGVPSLVAG